MILAGLGTLVPIGFSFIARPHLAPGALIYYPVEFIVFSALLIVAIPSAVKVNHKLNLPGGPLIAATLNCEPQPYGWGEVVLGGVLWSVIALVLLLIALFVGVGLLLYFFPSFIPPIWGPHIHLGRGVKPSAIWLVSEIVTSLFQPLCKRKSCFASSLWESSRGL